MKHPYLDHACGWNTLAGSDVSQRFKTTRYLLVQNKLLEKPLAAILYAERPRATDWKTLMEGKMKDVQAAFDKLDGPSNA